MKLLFLCLILLGLSSCQMTEQKATYTGVDHLGKSKTCSEMVGAICTEIFTPADAYAEKCRRSGKKVVQCDCHDFICVD
jgi:hypothetical protein